MTDIRQKSRDTIQKIGITHLQSFISRLLHRADKAADMAKNHPEKQHVYIWDESCDVEHTLNESNQALRTAIESLLRGMRNDHKAHGILTKDILELLVRNLDTIDSFQLYWILIEHIIALASVDTDDMYSHELLDHMLEIFTHIKTLRP